MVTVGATSQWMGGPTSAPVSAQSTASNCFPTRAAGRAVSAKWGVHDVSLGKGGRRFKADLQDEKDEVLGSDEMVGKHLKELVCRRKEDDVFSFEQVRFKKMAHPRDGIRGTRLECRSGLYTQIRDSVK